MLFVAFTLAKAIDLGRLKEIKNQIACNSENLPQQTKNISAVSLLYQYTNTPPLAYGSTARKTCESTIRADEHNNLPNNGRVEGTVLNRQHWRKSDGPLKKTI